MQSRVFLRKPTGPNVCPYGLPGLLEVPCRHVTLRVAYMSSLAEAHSEHLFNTRLSEDAVRGIKIIQVDGKSFISVPTANRFHLIPAHQGLVACGRFERLMPATSSWRSAPRQGRRHNHSTVRSPTISFNLPYAPCAAG